MSSVNTSEAGSEASDSDLLNELMRTEMCAIPFEHWGFFFPGHVAVWPFIEAKRSGVIGELKAGFRSEPYFEGKAQYGSVKCWDTTSNIWVCGKPSFTRLH